MKFAKAVFRIAGIYGLLVIPPMYFLEDRIGRDLPPPVTHPEYFYGFAGVALAFQIVFLIISTDPARFRPMMIPSIVEKATYGIAVLILVYSNRVAPVVAATAVVDLILGTLFVISFIKTKNVN